MKSKEQTPLAYLMTLLDVSLMDLADYLYVARTSVSKWKTGARALRPDSPHFAGIVEFFTLLARDDAKRETLLRLFRDVYPDQNPEGADGLAACLRAFMGGKLLPSAALRFSLGETGKLYSAEFSVYSGDAGYEAAVAQIAAYMAAAEKRETVYLTLGTGMADAGRGAALLGERLLSVLMKGHRVRLMVDPGDPGLPAYALAAVLAHPGAEICFPHPGPAFPEKETVLLLDGKMLLLSRMAPNSPRYSAIFADAFTVESRRAAMLSLWQQAGAPLRTLTPEDIRPERIRALLGRTLDEPMDWLLPSLPPMTMGRALLMETLEAGGVSGRVWSRALGCQDALAGVCHRLLIPAEAIRTPQRVCHALSLATGQPARLNEAQGRRHLLDTAAMLRAGDRLSLLPMQTNPPDGWRRAGLFVKRNALAGWMDFVSHTVRVTEDPRAVTRCMEAVDALRDTLTAELRDSGHVARLLERAALLPGAGVGRAE